MIHSIRLPALLVTFLALSLLAFGAAAQFEAGVTITTAHSNTYGMYLVTGQGRTVYLFTADNRGSGESACHGKCAKLWPPVVTSSQPQVEGLANAAMLGTIKRDDGSIQVTYHGWPLYFFVKDKGAGQTKGQDVHGFGGEWYLVTPAGTLVHAEE